MNAPLRHMKARRVQEYRGALEPLSTQVLQFLSKRLGKGRVAWILFLAASLSGAQAQYTYTTNNGALSITQYSGPGGAVSVPSTIKGLPVTAIANFAFSSNSNATSVTIPEGVTNIGFEAFYSCSALTNITLPASVSSIGDWAFQNCPKLATISVGSLNSAYSSLNGVLLDKRQTRLVSYPGGKSGTYTIPGTVAEVGLGAFGGCANLTGISIPGNVTNIGDSAFYNCASLGSVTIPGGVSNIGNSAFYSCKSLASVVVGGGVTGIGDYAFASCYKLAHVSLGSNVTSIGYGTFSGSGLTNVALPDSLQTIGEAAFEYCSNLTSVSIGKSLGSLANFAFDACTSLNQVALSNGLGSIGVEAFGRCPRLASLTIPGSVTNVGATAFAGCTNLTSVYFAGNAPAEGGALFGGDEKVIVYYSPQSGGWSATFDGVATVAWNGQIPSRDAGFGVRAGRFGFNVTGTSNLTIIVERSVTLQGALWVPLQTNVLTGGADYFSDPQWKSYATGFYRLRSP